MKIAIIRQKFVLYGGAEQFADSYIHQLAESGHEIHIFANQWIPSHHKNTQRGSPTTPQKYSEGVPGRGGPSRGSPSRGSPGLGRPG